MAKRRHKRAEVKKSPANRWPFGRFRRLLYMPKTMDQINQRQHRGGNEWHSDEAMGDTAMMLQSGDGALQPPDYVDVGCFGSQHHSHGGKRGFTIEARACHARSGQKMGNGIQAEILTDLKSS